MKSDAVKRERSEMMRKESDSETGKRARERNGATNSKKQNVSTNL